MNKHINTSAQSQSVLKKICRRNLRGYTEDISDLHYQLRYVRQALSDFVGDDGLSRLSVINELRIKTIIKKLRYLSKVADGLMAQAFEKTYTADKHTHRYTTGES